MDRALHEALRLWLRDAQVPEIIEVLELFAAELRTRDLVLEFVTENEVLPWPRG